jgi:hypothetical protein
MSYINFFPLINYQDCYHHLTNFTKLVVNGIVMFKTLTQSCVVIVIELTLHKQA